MRLHWDDIPIVRTDVLVCGAGGAGLRAAISAHQQGASVRVLCKLPLLAGGSTANGLSEIMSIGAAIAHSDEPDSPEVHFLDTMRAGWGFIDEQLVRIYAYEVPERFWDLVLLGVPFAQKTDGRFRQRHSDFATYRRTMAVPDGSTGRA
ncbi:MAG: FAD-binding protein, partial [Nitrospinota bacterium]